MPSVFAAVLVLFWSSLFSPSGCLDSLPCCEGLGHISAPQLELLQDGIRMDVCLNPKWLALLACCRRDTAQDKVNQVQV